ncbi:Verprolin-like [Caenorhabditis elegans]|nr:Verprolin-like [Caenorhabditis elegans]CCD64188.2 Verprolin-like [Caenorhabditis elegans]
MKYQLDEDDEEGLVHSPHSSFTTENLRSSDPMFFDINRWKREVGTVIRSENHVLIHNDDEIRNAISKAMLLDSASEHLQRKRKRLIDILDEQRVEEGITGKKLFEEKRSKIQEQLGRAYPALENKITKAFYRSSLPIVSPDVRRPPPSLSIPLPPMHIPPPSVYFISTPSIYSTAKSSTSTVTSKLSKAIITPTPPQPLSSPHLLPPRTSDYRKTYAGNFKRSDTSKEGKHVFDATKFKAMVPRDNTSWRTPFHPTPVPPPSIHTFLKGCLPSPFVRKIPEITPRRHSTGTENRPSSPLGRRSLPPPGLVGINVRGLFVGNRSNRQQTPEPDESPKSSSSSGTPSDRN